MACKAKLTLKIGDGPLLSVDLDLPRAVTEEDIKTAADVLCQKAFPFDIDLQRKKIEALLRG